MAGSSPAMTVTQNTSALRTFCGKNIADLLEQYLAARRWGGHCVLADMQPCQRLDQPKDRETDDQELDHSVEEHADVHGHRAGPLCVGEGWRRRSLQRHEDVREIDAADQEADDR